MLNTTRNEIEKAFQAEELLFLGVAPLENESAYQEFVRWVGEKKHGEMAYLERYLDIRREPAKLLPGSKVALICALPYSQGDRVRDVPVEGESPLIAQYARFRDYHHLLKERGGKVAESLKSAFPGNEFRVVVDSAPILERALSAKTARGFIGKNTCYIHPEHGSFLLLGEVLTTLEVPFDARESEENCGTCTRCQVHCPTGALDEAFRLDAQKCLSYWTIEHRGTIPEEFWPHLAKYYFGCDLCQLVCPFNAPAKTPSLPRSIATREFPPLYEVATMNQQNYEKYFGGTPLTRAKRSGLRRNALIAMAVTRDARLSEAIALAEQDPESPVAETIEQIRKRGIILG